MAGVTAITLDLTVSDSSKLRTKLTFEKECHVGPLPGETFLFVFFLFFYCLLYVILNSQ